MKNNNQNLGWVLVFSAIGFAAVTIYSLIVYWLVSKLKNIDVGVPELYLVPILVLGVGLLIILLALVSAIFAALRLSNPSEALGLPEGSIRAVIALALILIFIIVAVFLYSQVNMKNPEAGKDFAIQILTTVSTLVVAVSGFYFGTKSVLTAHEVAKQSKPAPIIRSMTPTAAKPGDTISATISGKYFRSPTDINLTKNKSEIKADNILSNSTTITCSFTLKEDVSVGMWSLVVVNEDDSQDDLDDAIEIISK